MRLFLVLPFFLLVTLSPAQAADESMAHTHIRHVLESWNDTPANAGLLNTALKEAGIALNHAQLALKKPDDLEWLQTHTRHVLHAIDPEQIAQGPGLGYGVIKAARGSIKHINAAAASEGATDNIKTHAGHVAMSTQNAVDRAEQILKLGEAVRQAQSADVAADLVRQIKALTEQIIDGFDANDDGQITWHEREGGLNTAFTHAGIMAQGEGMTLAE